MNIIIDELKDRKLSLTEAISKRVEGLHESNEWDNTPLDELVGRLQEINHTLDLIDKYW